MEDFDRHLKTERRDRINKSLAIFTTITAISRRGFCYYWTTLERGALFIFLLVLLAATEMSAKEYYRADGVRITHDPYSPEMAQKYGVPGKTDNEGFNPYSDTVGPGW